MTFLAVIDYTDVRLQTYGRKTVIFKKTKLRLKGTEDGNIRKHLLFDP